jgi:transcriptional regulator with XRE-family HTH domain
MNDDGGVGAQLRACRVSAGLSQEELAERAGLSVRTIRNLECGRARWPYRETLHRLADALELRHAARAAFMGAADRRLASGGRSASAGPVRAADGHVVPRQLPTSAWQFVGRQRELGTLTRLVDRVDGGDAAVIAAIVGIAGIGKTALVLHWAHLVADRFPDGQLYLNLRGFDPSGKPVHPVMALRSMLAALEVPAERIPSELEAQASLYRSLLARRRVLLVLDNASDVGQVRPLLPGGPRCLVVVTSRRRLAGLVAAEGAHSLELDVLSDSEARELLSQRLGAERLEAETDATAELLGLCAGLPLALAIAAARISARPRLGLGTLAGELEDAWARLDALDAGDGRASVRAVFSWWLSSLPTPAVRMFGLLGMHPGPDITIPATASLAGVTPAQARRSLSQLAEAHLVT